MTRLELEERKPELADKVVSYLIPITHNPKFTGYFLMVRRELYTIDGVHYCRRTFAYMRDDPDDKASHTEWLKLEDEDYRAELEGRLYARPDIDGCPTFI